jgi:phosphoglycolate phosphatase-like HAD superfamily hydrolase
VLGFIFDIDGTLVDSNELDIDSWDRARSGDSANNSFGGQLRAQIRKGSEQYLPAFLTPEEIKRFGKEPLHLTNRRPAFSRRRECRARAQVTCPIQIRIVFGDKQDWVAQFFDRTPRHLLPCRSAVGW